MFDLFLCSLFGIRNLSNHIHINLPLFSRSSYNANHKTYIPKKEWVRRKIRRRMQRDNRRINRYKV